MALGTIGGSSLPSADGLRVAMESKWSGVNLMALVLRGQLQEPYRGIGANGSQAASFEMSESIPVFA